MTGAGDGSCILGASSAGRGVMGFSGQCFSDGFLLARLYIPDRSGGRGGS